jgi:hypothetical protein
VCVFYSLPAGTDFKKMAVAQDFASLFFLGCAEISRKLLKNIHLPMMGTKPLR